MSASANTQSTGRSAATQRAKAAAAVVLAMVFAGVMVVRLGGIEDAASGASEIAQPEISAASVAVQASPNAPLQAKTRARLLPRPELIRMMALNPFLPRSKTRLDPAEIAGRRDTGRQPPSSAEPARLAEVAGRTEASIAAPPEVRAIIHDAVAPAVLIGDQLLGLNDTIDENWRIVAVKPDGVILEPVTDEESATAE